MVPYCTVSTQRTPHRGAVHTCPQESKYHTRHVLNPCSHAVILTRPPYYGHWAAGCGLRNFIKASAPIGFGLTPCSWERTTTERKEGEEKQRRSRSRSSSSLQSNPRELQRQLFRGIFFDRQSTYHISQHPCTFKESTRQNLFERIFAETSTTTSPTSRSLLSCSAVRGVAKYSKIPSHQQPRHTSLYLGFSDSTQTRHPYIPLLLDHACPDILLCLRAEDIIQIVLNPPRSNGK